MFLFHSCEHITNFTTAWWANLKRSFVAPRFSYCKTNPKQKRPRNRTLTSKSSASCHLDIAQRNYVEHKLKTITGLYKKLSGKDVQIEFPEWVL
ncbi:40S ribosomal protein [Sparganum proliferum]